MAKSEKFQQLPAPWDRIFSLGTRLFVWSLLITIVYILRPFFLLIFLTFVFAYIQSHAVEGLEHRFKNRAYRVTIVFLVFLGVIVGTLYFLAPHVRNQFLDFTRNYETYLGKADNTIYDWVEANPSVRKMFEDPGETKNGKKKNGEKKNGEDDTSKQGSGGEEPGAQKPKPIEREPILKPAILKLIQGDDTHPSTGPPGEEKKKDQITAALKVLGSAVSGILGVASSFLLSILFSFLIVLDLPRLSRACKGLAKTRLDFIYDEAADNIYEFGKRLGRALEAQLLIALFNTVFTAIGIYFMGLGSIIFLASIVFFCSFIPVAGVFISSAPICLLCLQVGGDNGVQLILVAIAFILVIHAIEAYILNPKIYGHHLHMNSVLVLIVLTVAGKVVGVWGLVLGLPVMQYIFATAIRRDPSEIEQSGVVPAIESGD